MKKIAILVIVLLFTIPAGFSQVLLAKWTFPTGAATDSLADGGISANLSKGIHTEGGTSVIDFSKNGASTKAAQASGWDNGEGLKCWVTHLTTTGYENLTIASKQQSGGNNPGPRDWKVQYRIGLTGSWNDIPGTTLTVLNDWTTGVLNSIPLPEVCENSDEVFFRWIMTSNAASGGGTVTPAGIDKIDDIYFYGDPVTGTGLLNDHAGLTLFPNPVQSILTLNNAMDIRQIKIYTSSGALMGTYLFSGKDRVLIPVGDLKNGLYFLQVNTGLGISVLRFIKD